VERGAAAAREERVGRRLGVGVEVEQKGLAEEEEAMVVGGDSRLSGRRRTGVAAGLALIKEGNRRNVTRSDQQTGGG
jgi:hypothetical protein